MHPNASLYEVFASEVAFSERQSNDLSLPAERRQRVGQRLQLVTGLNDGDYSALKLISRQLHAALDANAKEGDAALRNFGQTIAQREATMAALRDKRDAAVDNAIDQWKAHIGARFRFVDEKIRAHVAPGLRISDTPANGSTAAGGRQK